MSDQAYSGYGHGKIILLGEHFVVWGHQAIACALSQQTHATITKSDVFSFIDDRPKTPSFKPLQTLEYHMLVQDILSYVGIADSVTVRLIGDLPVFSGGLGSSAACAAAIAQAACRYGGIDADKHFINKVALQGEKAVHGNPSGIDNTAAVFGGMFSFQKNADDQHPLIENFAPSFPMHVVVVDSGIKAKTKDCIAAIAKMKNDSPCQWRSLVEQYQSLYDQAVEALVCGDICAVGLLLTQNHILLQQLDLSLPVVDNIVQDALVYGALGAKVTGTGRGGSIIMLAKDSRHQKQLELVFQQQGYSVLATTVAQEEKLSFSTI